MWEKKNDSRPLIAFKKILTKCLFFVYIWQIILKQHFDSIQSVCYQHINSPKIILKINPIHILTLKISETGAQSTFSLNVEIDPQG